MQHQQGVIVADDGRLLVTDSYNDALKLVDPGTRRAETWLRDFHEPSGVAMNERCVYVADTNAHRIVVIDRKSEERTELRIDGVEMT
jgi:sugar lactone lactonase YvrE